MNDWKFKTFLKTILALQFSIWSTIALDAIGFKIPIIRQFIGFIYLMFVPGILILRVLKMHKLGNIETLLYTVGLSITTLMFSGLFMNTIYPIFGISKPLSNISIIITISILVLILCVLSYARDKDFSNPTFISFENLLSTPALFLLLIPFISVFGTYLFNYYNINLLLMFLIIIIAVVVVLIGFDVFIPNNLYALSIFVISLSLLYHRSLITTQLWGWDINIEYYYANLVKMNLLWDSRIPSNVNAMLSITMLSPIFSHVCNLSLVWVFKIIYPLLFSLVPLGLYRVVQKQIDDKIAFLSSFFFMSNPVFFGEMNQLARQQIAELFLILLILLMVSKEINVKKRSTLLIILSFSQIVSHYGLSYIYLFSLFLFYPALFFIETNLIREIKDALNHRFRKPRNKDLDRIINPRFILYYTIFVLIWYIFISGSSNFYTIVNIVTRISNVSFINFFNPDTAEGLGFIFMKLNSPLHELYKILHILFQFFILVGFLPSSIHLLNVKFGKEYKAFSVINLGLCLIGLSVPHFASSLNTTRLYQITLFFLSPFCVIGGIEILLKIKKLSGMRLHDDNIKDILKVLSILFTIFLLFTSRVIFEVSKTAPSSISFDKTIKFPMQNDQEFHAATWLSNTKDSSHIYSDYFGKQLLKGFVSGGSKLFFTETNEIPDGSYIYLGSSNLQGSITEYYTENKGVYKKLSYDEEFMTSTFYNVVITNNNRIYDNDGSEIYR